MPAFHLARNRISESLFNSSDYNVDRDGNPIPEFSGISGQYDVPIEAVIRMRLGRSSFLLAEP